MAGWSGRAGRTRCCLRSCRDGDLPPRRLCRHECTGAGTRLDAGGRRWQGAQRKGLRVCPRVGGRIRSAVLAHPDYTERRSGRECEACVRRCNDSEVERPEPAGRVGLDAREREHPDGIAASCHAAFVGDEQRHAGARLIDRRARKGRKNQEWKRPASDAHVPRFSKCSTCLNRSECLSVTAARAVREACVARRTPPPPHGRRTLAASPPPHLPRRPAPRSPAASSPIH